MNIQPTTNDQKWKAATYITLLSVAIVGAVGLVNSVGRYLDLERKYDRVVEQAARSGVENRALKHELARRMSAESLR